MKLQTDLRAFIASLNDAGVKYLVVGGYAVGFHGHPRYTGDIDFFVEVSRENAEAILRAVERFGFGSVGLSADDFLKADAVVQLGFPPNRIDITTGIEAVTFAEAWESRIAAELDGLPMGFLSRELLIRNKKAAGRPKDLGDVASLE